MPLTANLGILKRMFGQSTDALSQSNAEQWPELAAAWMGRQTEMPKEAQGVKTLRPMNMLEKMYYGPTVNAATYPWGSIAMNRENIEKNKINLPSTLVHEMTHIGQGQRGASDAMARGGSMDMPDYEQEAYDAENNRYKKVRTTDIPLRNPNAPIRNAYKPPVR